MRKGDYMKPKSIKYTKYILLTAFVSFLFFDFFDRWPTPTFKALAFIVFSWSVVLLLALPQDKYEKTNGRKATKGSGCDCRGPTESPKMGGETASSENPPESGEGNC